MKIKKALFYFLFVCGVSLTFLSCENPKSNLGLYVLNYTESDIFFKIYSNNKSSLTAIPFNEIKMVFNEEIINFDNWSDVLYNIDSCSVYRIENNDTIEQKTWYCNSNINSIDKNFFSQKEWHLFSDSLSNYSLYFVITEEDLIE